MQYIIIGLVSLFLYSPALADTLQGKVVKVADGDTVTIMDDSGKKGLPSKKSEWTEEKSTEQLAEIAKNQALMVMCLQ